MACERYREALTDHAAGGPAESGLEAHLAACPACRNELAALRHALAAVDAELRSLTAAELSPELAARVRRAAAELEAAPPWRPSFLWPALAAAAVVAAFFGIPRLGSVREPAGRVVESAPPASSALPLPTPRPSSFPVPSPSLTIPVPPRVAAAAAARPTWKPAKTSEPEVLVPSGETEALFRLVALVHRTQLKPSALAAAGEPSPDLAELEPIDLKPLEIAPLDPAETPGTKAEGDRR